MSFLIQWIDGDEPGFEDVTDEQAYRMMQPNSLPSRHDEDKEVGLYYTEVKGCRFHFNWEPPGIQVGYDEDAMPKAEAQNIIEEISQNIAQAAKVRTRVLDEDDGQVWRL